MTAVLTRLREQIGLQTNTSDTSDRLAAAAYPPITPARLSDTEQHLGFSLPHLLGRIYTEIANGGIGPGYGLLGITDGAPDDLGHTALDLYQIYRQSDPDDPLWYWPPAMLPICHWGCAIYSCLDCRTPNTPVLIFDPNGHTLGTPWNDAFLPHTASFEEWLTLWLDGVDLWAVVYGNPNDA
jgi:hypothetical protein